MPDPTITQPRLGPVGLARFAWRQLTSMRTALFLLLLLAVAALPGSIWPQRSINPARTAAYIDDHPRLGPWLDRLGFFEVYASPWFSAVYLLLFLSLVGCVLPRIRVHLRAVRMPPPRVPARLERLQHHSVVETTRSAPEVLAAARASLGRRYRVAVKDDSSLSAETGYLRESGNIVFHLALIGILVGVAVGHIYGWKGDVIVPVGTTFADTESRFDTIQYGPQVNPDNFPPFSLSLDKLTVTFEDRVGGRGQFGSPRDFVAEVSTRETPDAEPVRHTLKVNHPVEMDGATVFLLGNGYAPVITVKDPDGKVLYSQATPFLARDNNYTSSGAIKVPAARPKQLGFFGNFLPTGIISDDQGPISIFPDAKDPALALGLFEGELAPGGRASSVYTLDTSAMTQVKQAGKDEVLRLWIKPGETVKLPGNRGTITFDRVERWAGLSIRHDPAKNFTLLSALLALGALIAQLTIKRRRVFVRMTPDGDRNRVVVAALSKTDDDGLTPLVDRIAAALGDPGASARISAGEEAAAAGGAHGIRP
ncbi:MAG: cytochrome c biogenesis protein ResB [Dermatophilaceae bacterium]